MNGKIEKRMVLALALSLLLGACGEEFPGKKSGKEVAVRVRLLGVAEGGEEDITRSVSSKEQEKQVTPVGDGLLMEMQIEQDFPALRANQTPLASTSYFRVVALKHNTKTFISYGDFTGDGILVAGSLHVPINDSYDFVCYSYNNNTPLPDLSLNYKQDAAIPDTETIPVFQGTKDLLWAKIKMDVTDTDPELEILLNRVMVRVKVVIDLSYNQWTITGISGDITLNPVGTGGTIRLTDKDVATHTGTPTFSSWTGTGYQRESTNELLVMPNASGTTVNIPIDAIERQDTTAIPAKVAASTFGELKSGYSYKLRVRLRIPIWAKSNIYWDDTAKKLTFIPADGNTNYQGYQGVHFKYGSLVGISPMGDFTGSTDIYVPIVKPVLNTSTWKATTGSAMAADNTDFPEVKNNWDTWGENSAEPTDIPYLDPSHSAAGTVAFGRSNRYAIDDEQNVYDVYKDFRGDICQYLYKTGAVSGDYRLPTSDEFGPATVTSWAASNPTVNANADGWIKGSGTFISNNNVGYTNGRADLLSNQQSATFDPNKNTHAATTVVYGSAKHQTMTDVVFPTTGYRGRGDGKINNIGGNGVYWSGSANHALTGHYLHFYSSTISPASTGYRSYGLAVRCVKN
jgi:hypothetical protein